MSHDKKSQEKEDAKTQRELKKEKASEKRKEGQIRLILPKELESKIRSESNPDAIVADALMTFYAERNPSPSLIQREVDNNIIEIQRRHIADLKEQLANVNHNYDTLMQTHQAYMLQVQPLIEKAQLEEGAPLRQILAPKEKETSAPLKDGEADARADEKMVSNEKASDSAEKKKKWYEFWK